MRKQDKRPTIVVVSHICPFPPVHGNRTRLLALLRWLRETGYRVTFILQPLDVDTRAGVSQLAEAVDRLEVIRPSGPVASTMNGLKHIASRLARAILPRTLTRVLRRAVPSSLSDSPTAGTGTSEGGDMDGGGHIDRWCWARTCQAVVRAVRRDRPFAVLAEYALLSKCLLGLPAGTLKVIDTVELFFRNRERFLMDGLAAPHVCTPDSERLALSRGDVLVAIHRNDASALREIFPETVIVTASHSYPLLTRQADRLAVGTILYVGSSNPFNVHGLEQFLREAWGAIVTSVPGVTLRIVGSVRPIQGPVPEHVVRVGRVTDEDLALEYQRAHVVINPQLAGTGLKIKCVEALSAGCPMVMNSAGADGLEEGAGSAFLLASNWTEFSAHVIRLLRDEPFRLTLEAGATLFASRLFSSAAVFSELASVLPDPRGDHSANRGATARSSTHCS